MEPFLKPILHQNLAQHDEKYCLFSIIVYQISIYSDHHADTFLNDKSHQMEVKYKNQLLGKFELLLINWTILKIFKNEWIYQLFNRIRDQKQLNSK